MGVDPDHLALAVDHRPAAGSRRGRHAVNDEIAPLHVGALIGKVDRRDHRGDDAALNARGGALVRDAGGEHVPRKADHGDRIARFQLIEVFLRRDRQVGPQNILARVGVDRIDDEERCVIGVII